MGINLQAGVYSQYDIKSTKRRYKTNKRRIYKLYRRRALLVRVTSHLSLSLRGKRGETRGILSTESDGFGEGTAVVRAVCLFLFRCEIRNLSPSGRERWRSTFGVFATRKRGSSKLVTLVCTS